MMYTQSHNIQPNTELELLAFLADATGVKYVVCTTKKPRKFAFLLPPEYNFDGWYNDSVVFKAIFEHYYTIFDQPKSSFKYQDRKKILSEPQKQITGGKD